jgi:hypothetical protein
VDDQDGGPGYVCGKSSAAAIGGVNAPNDAARAFRQR